MNSQREDFEDIRALTVNVGTCPFCQENDNYVERIELSSCAVICNCGAQGPQREPEDDADLEYEEKHDLSPGHAAAVRAWQAAMAQGGKQDPVCYLTWHQGMVAIDDYVEYLEISDPDKFSIDGTPAFPVYIHPPKPTGGGVPDSFNKLPDEVKDQVYEAISDALGDAYDCLRVWSAWSYGTMGPDDFVLTSEDGERVNEIASAAIDALLATQQPPEQDDGQ